VCCSCKSRARNHIARSSRLRDLVCSRDLSPQAAYTGTEALRATATVRREAVEHVPGHNETASIQSDIICHNQSVTAFISAHQWPNNHGNVVIVPHEHFENIYNLPVHYAGEMQRVARMIALAMKSAYACAGISTRQPNEPAGSQDVWHYHLHITPRYMGDNVYLTQRQPMSVDERAKHVERIKAFLVEQL